MFVDRTYPTDRPSGMVCVLNSNDGLTFGSLADDFEDDEEFISVMMEMSEECAWDLHLQLKNALSETHSGTSGDE